MWNGQWYSGHHTPAYSVLFPPLAWLLGGPWRAGALAAVAAAALFEPLARREVGPRALGGSLAFALAVGATLFAGRLTFLAGMAVAVGSLLALRRGARRTAVALAVLCSLTSPVSGLFLALAALTVALAGGSPGSGRRWGAAVVVASLAPPGLLTLAFPEGGSQPFVLSSFLAVPLFALGALVVMPRRFRALRLGALLYALAALGSFLVPTPMGGNAVRLGQVAGAAAVACALAVPGLSRARLVAGGALVAGLLAWAVVPAYRDLERSTGNPAAEAAYFAPLVAFLDRELPPGARVEIPFTREHWEAAEVARRHPLARGWLRTIDIAHNGLFYDGRLTDARYARWLRDNAVRYVASADAPLDYSARAEAALVAGRPPYLRPRWRSAHWTVYEVLGAPPLVTPEGGAEISLLAASADELSLEVRHPGRVYVRVRHTRWWRAAGACVQPAGAYTQVRAPRSGRLLLSAEPGLPPPLREGRGC